MRGGGVKGCITKGLKGQAKGGLPESFRVLKSLRLNHAPTGSTSRQNEVQTVNLPFFPACQNGPVGQA